ncbi:hypothetical protein PTI98_000160 [Pleurotus ostreatus]|nr:hypothetical protein PTI98_000160 [Pleurotus ostreatus]
MQHELIVDIPVTKKKQTKAKKNKNITSANRDAADEEANETMVENLTVTARTLQESGAPLAPPARRVGTGVTLAPITPSITTSRIRREEPEDIPQIASKDKGKGRDLTNLGSSDTEEIDEGEDDEAEKSDEEGDKEKDADAGSNGDEDGEPKKTDDEDDDEDDSAEVPMHADLSDNNDDTMEVAPTTPKRPATPAKPTTASKRRASTSPTTTRQMGKGLRKGITHASGSSRRASPSPTSDDLEDLQGASRTMGGVARGKAMGIALNMADFDTNMESDAPPVMGMVHVFKNGASPLEGPTPLAVKVPIKNTLGPVLTAAAKKMVALISSDILLWDAKTLMWEVKGPYAIAVDDNEAAIWDDENILRIGIQPSEVNLSYLLPPSPSINSTSASSAVSSIAPSASISVAGTSTTPVNSLITAFPNDPLLLRIATRMEVPLHMTNSGKGNGGLVNMYARYQLAVGAMAKWNRLTTPWDGAPVEEAVLRSIFIKRTNFGTYGALFKRCLKFPMLMDMLQNPDYDFTSEAHTKVWGGREVGRMTLGKVLDELEAELAAEEAKVVAEKAKKAKEAKKKCAAKKATNFCLQGLWMVLSVLFLLGLLPCATAAPLEDPFPDIRFADFAKVIKLTFGENISLATVLMLLFSITTNTDILNLHGQQRAVSSNNQVVTSWMAAFVCAIKDKLQVDVSDVPGDSDDDDAGAGNVDSDSGSSEDNMDASDNNSNSGSDISFWPATTTNRVLQRARPPYLLCRKLLSISTSSIWPIIIITPPVMGCSTAGCHGHGLTQYLCERDISKVTLLHGSECFEKVPVLAGRCPKCSTMFCADHESFIDDNRQLALYLPNAKYLKVGKQVWVDRIVSKAVMNANYSFHASTAAITEFWNYSFVQPSGASFTLTHRQVWKAFVLESIRLLAGFSNSTMIFMDNLKISELVAAAYLYLGDGGIIRSAVGHSCDECCHAFKDVADVIPNQDDNPAALAGHDENRDVPEYAGPAVAAAVADAVEVMCTLVVQMYNKVALYQAPGSHALGTTHRHCQHPWERPRSSWDDWC